VFAVGALRAFFDANRRLSQELVGRWPHERFDTNTRYCEDVARIVRERPGQLVVDIGGGRALRYADHLRPGEATVIAVDVSAEELKLNHQVAETRVADVVDGLPFADGEVDVLTSSSVLEHLPDIGRFLDEAARVLRPGGAMVHILPCRYATFAILNRMLPHRVKSWVLAHAYPETIGVCGFRAYYDRCYHKALVRACRERGFRVESTSVGYCGSSEYYAILFPAALVSELIELATWLLRARDLGTTLVIVARR
jgi:ubiquinone/menaquinone biosynthesis C-methylase UbiE